MSEEVKFTEEEIKQVQGIQTNYANIQNAFGLEGASRSYEYTKCFWTIKISTNQIR